MTKNEPTNQKESKMTKNKPTDQKESQDKDTPQNDANGKYIMAGSLSFMVAVIVGLSIIGVVITQVTEQYTKRMEICVQADMKYVRGDCRPIENDE